MNTIAASILWIAFVLCSPEAKAAGLEEHLLHKENLRVVVQRWSLVGPGGALEQRECRPAEKLFEEMPLRVLASLKSGVVGRVDVLFLEPVPSQPAASFEENFKRLRSVLPGRIDQHMQVSFSAVAADTSLPAGTEVLAWTRPEATLLLAFEPGKRVWMTLRPSEVVPSSMQADREPSVGGEKRSLVNRLPNGDVIIHHAPAVPPVENSDDSARRVVAFLQKFHGWNVDLETLWKRAASGAGDEGFERVMARELAKEAGVRHEVLNGLDLGTVRREIDQGRPVVVLRGHEDKRHELFRAFAARLKTDSTAVLPSTKDSADRKKWALPGSASYALLTIVHGYNAKRGELIFSQPGWDVVDQSLRMRQEEMAASTYNTFMFSAK